MRTASRSPVFRTRWTRVVSVVVVLLGSVAFASPAWAHGGGETEEGYLLVQQALGHLAHDTGQEGVMAAQEKIHDTLATADQEGVDVSLVEQAQADLTAGEVEAGRALLQESITEAVSALPPATGEETGTSVIGSDLAGRGDLGARDWVFLAISATLALAGTALALRYRPAHTVRALGRQLALNTSDDGRSPQPRKDAS
ncbi:MAG: hypothetical protein HHJ13_12020 [Phycicoccus sp.]|nr:hypothetical protein [Phycicoccus sp.]